MEKDLPKMLDKTKERTRRKNKGCKGSKVYAAAQTQYQQRIKRNAAPFDSIVPSRPAQQF
jgi:hypothetical protein